jgi:hypothetical protein
VTNEELNDAIPLTTEKLQVLAGKLNVTPTLVTAKRTDILRGIVKVRYNFNY